MTTTQLATNDLPALPAHLQARALAALEKNREAMGGIKAGGWPRLNIGGSKFTIVDGEDKTLITLPGTEFAAPMIEVVVVGFNPAVSKQYYAGKWDEGSADAPDCSSDNGIVPDANIATPQARACSTCPQNVWGSKISEQGKQIKACSDNKRLVVVPVSDLTNHKALDLTIKPGSLKDWAEYVRLLDSKGIPVGLVVTQVYFEPSATFPKLAFKMGRFLTEEEAAIADQRTAGDDVRLILAPRTTTATGPVIPVTPVAPVPAAVVAPPPAVPAAPAPAPAPAPVVTPPAAPAPADPFSGVPVYVKPAVDAAGGLGTPAGDAVFTQLTGKPAPTAAAPAPVDPFAGHPAHVKPAVDAAGGLGTPGGDAVFAALTKTAAPAPEKKTRGRKAAPPPAAAPTPTPTPTPAAAPTPSSPAPVVPPAPSLATPASGTVATAAGLGGDLDALLAQAMKVPTA